MSIKVKRKKARRVSRIWKEDLERKYVRKEENWETFNLFLNREIGYRPKSIYDIIYDMIYNNLNKNKEDLYGEEDS